MTPQLDPKHAKEWVRIRNTARAGNQPKFTAKSVQALDVVEAFMSQQAAEIRRLEHEVYNLGSALAAQIETAKASKE